MNQQLSQQLIGILENMPKEKMQGSRDERLDAIIGEIERLFPATSLLSAASGTAEMVAAMRRIDVQPLIEALRKSKGGERMVTTDAYVNRVLDFAYRLAEQDH